MDIIKELLKNFSGGPEAIAVIILALGALWIFGHYFMVFAKFIWKEVYPKIKEAKSPETIDYNKIFDSYFKEKIIILVEERLKELKDFNKIFKDNYEDNVTNLINEFGNRKDQEIMDKVFEIYERITDLRERYAGKMATREDIERLSRDIRVIEKELSTLKEKVAGS